MTYIVSFGDVGQSDVDVAGGKGVGLGGLVEAGLPVPPGFVLNTAAYADFVDANQLQAGIRELAALAPQVRAALGPCPSFPQGPSAPLRPIAMPVAYRETNLEVQPWIRTIAYFPLRASVAANSDS